MKKRGVVSSLFRLRASLALIDEDFGCCGVRFARGRGYCRAPAWRLTNESHGHMISDKSDEGQYTSLRVEMGNPNLNLKRVFRLVTALTVVFLTTTSTAGGCLPVQRTNQQTEDRLDAAIVDQLSLYEPNPHFIEKVSQQLESEGFVVDLYAGKEVTVQLYQELPTYGYELLIFRAHAGFLDGGSGSEQAGATYIFTGEEYTVTENTFDQLFDEISPAEAFNGYPKVFAVNSKFVSNSMKGNFKDTAIIMMGCATAHNADMAQSFVAKGASVYIGWSASVCLNYVDQATENIVDELIVKRTTVELALSNTVDEVGLDQEYNARPQYYPSGAGTRTIYGLINN